MQLIQIKESQEWTQLITALPGAHILQSWQWGQVKSHFGWEPLPFVWHDDAGKLAAASLILRRTVTIGGFPPRLRVLYAPKGPLLNWSDKALAMRVLDNLQNFTKRQSAIFIKIDPDLCLGWGVPGEADARQDQSGLTISENLLERGWTFSEEQIQFRNTVLIDLTPDEDQILARMKQKTRYNIRLSTRRGVSVRSGGLSDLDMLYEMYAKTAVRDGFVIRSPEYYRLVWETFIKAGFAEPLIAESEGKPIAAVFIFRFAGTARYLYGMSLEEQRDKMPNYLLQWEAIRQSKAAGCITYDMWGAPDEFDASDSLWGVYRFKKGFNGQVLRTLGAWDYPSRPLLYSLYTNILPRVMNLMRRRGKSETKKRIMT